MRPASVEPRRRQRGANMVETLIAVPLLLLLGFGLIEMGLAWRDTLTVRTATRSGARIASNLGDERLTDWAALQAVDAALADLDPTDVQQIIVYLPDDSGAIDPACLVNGGTSVADQCNAYGPAQLASLTAASFTGAEACAVGAPDAAWCPLDRSSVQASLDSVGVYLRVRVRPITGVLPFGDLTISDTTVMRIEPRLEAPDAT